MTRILLLSALLNILFLTSHAQNTKVQGNWILDNVELSNFAEEQYAFTPEESFFAYFLDQNNQLDLNQTHLSLIIGEESQTYEIEFDRNELKLSASNTIYIKKNDGPVETKIAIGETVFKVQQSKNKLILFRKNQTFYERYTFISAN